VARTLPRRVIIALVGVLAVAVALPPVAGAVLSGKNGRILFISGRLSNDGDDSQSKLFLRKVTSTQGAGGPATGPLEGTAGQHRHPTWSPDRTMIAYARGGGSCNPACDIFVLDLTTPGATPQNITNTPTVTEDRPAWSPDGTRIAYESTSTNQVDIIVDSDPLAAGGTVNLTDSASVIEGKPAWSPDSQTIYYSVGNVNVAPNGNNNDVKIFQEPADNSGTPTQVVHISGAHTFQPSISPDGTSICYTLSPSQGLNASASILVAPLTSASSGTVLATGDGGNYNCTWSPDGTKIAYVRGVFTSGALVMEESDNSSPVAIELEDDAGNFDGNPDWAPDARPICPDFTVITSRNEPVTIPLECMDTGPDYEQTPVREGIANEGNPTNGTLGQVETGDPSLVTYTPNQGFTGTDTVKFIGFDDFGFGTDLGTVTIQVLEPDSPVLPPGAGGGRVPTCAGALATIIGTAGSDALLAGTPNADVIVGLGGDDEISGGDGSDRICGKRGDDALKGGRGHDRLIAGSGNDRALGNGGRDRLKGNGGRDRLRGGSGRDRLRGASRADRLFGGRGADRLFGGRGRDRLFGGPGPDRLRGGPRRDRLRGGPGLDSVRQ
jgi:Tol biopolymer transport system component